ncbi:MAG TPA: hypothetical protein VFC29_06625 [Candidatus Limnocylindrales bacterium]|jgi:hypothetical protein|nr:hypothetical protein [Candidatus Limnocylindrales bacterium]
MRLSRDKIESLCTSWAQAVRQGQGFAIGGQSEQYRLWNNGIGFHELDYDEIRTACVELAKILLLPGRNTIIDLDHILLWSWLSELLIGRDGPMSSSANREIHDLAQITARSASAGSSVPTREGFDRARQADGLLTLNAREFLRGGYIALSYLSFPLLETIARRSCGAFVGLSGEVLQTFPKGHNQSYIVGKYCSNVGDVLRLLINQVASAELKSDIEDILQHVASIEGATDGSEVIYRWRNSSLHGETTLQTIGGTVFSLGLLISLDSIKSSYADKRTAALERVTREQEIQSLTGMANSRSPWSYYPPF